MYTRPRQVPDKHDQARGAPGTAGLFDLIGDSAHVLHGARYQLYILN